MDFDECGKILNRKDAVLISEDETTMTFLFAKEKKGIEIARLTEARMEVTKIYANFPLELQKKLNLKADSQLQEEIGKIEKEFAKKEKAE